MTTDAGNRAERLGGGRRPSRAARQSAAPPRILRIVAQRLLLGLAPALLAVIVVLALAYYGEIGRQALEYVVSGAAVLAILSLVLTWRNTRYLVERLHRLGRYGEAADGNDMASPLDDLDRIEREVVRLRDALENTRTQAQNERTESERRLHDQSTLVSATVRGATAQLDEVRLPLHILLDARFGDLNENQEELLVSARDGAESLDAALRRLATLADADRDGLPVHAAPVAVNDVIRAILPMVRATAERRGVRITTDLEPGLHRAWADRAALAEALALLATHLLESQSPPVGLAVRTRQDATWCAIQLAPAPKLPAAIDVVPAALLRAQGITVMVHDGEIEVRVPRHVLPSR